MPAGGSCDRQLAPALFEMASVLELPTGAMPSKCQSKTHCWQAYKPTAEMCVTPLGTRRCCTIPKHSHAQALHCTCMQPLAIPYITVQHNGCCSAPLEVPTTACRIRPVRTILTCQHPTAATCFQCLAPGAIAPLRLLPSCTHHMPASGSKALGSCKTCDMAKCS
jgi:hypothetical protein